MKKLLLSTLVASTLVSTLNADFIGAEAGYAVWGTKLTGDIRKNGDNIDFEKDLGYGSSKTNNFMWGYVDHPLPLLPNIKVQHTSFSDDSQGIIHKTIKFANQEFQSSSSVKSEIELNQLDLIPYWRILDNWVNLDIGVNIKTIQGKIKMDTTTISPRHVDENFNVTIPMLYAKARFDIPFSGLSVEADGSYLSYDGNKISDIKAGVVYQSSIGLGATLGVRDQKIILDDVDDIYGNINISGIYTGIFFHF